MKQAKKLLTVILCAAMLIMSVPTQAFADGEDPSAPIETLAVDETTESLTETTVADETAEVSTEISITEDAGEVPAEALAVADTDVAKIGDTGYATFEEALAAAVAGDTIELIADVTLAASITISKDITLQPAEGKTVTIHRGAFRTPMFTASKSLTLNGNGGNLIIDGQQESGQTAYNAMILCTGTLVMNDGVTLQNNINDSSNHGGAIRVEGGTFTMNGGLITNCGETSKANTSAYTTSGGGAIRLQGVSGRDTTAVMNGGTISNCFGYNGGAVCVTNYYTKNVTFTMNGGRITECVAGVKLAEKEGTRTGEGAAFYTFNKAKTTAFDTVVTINGGEIDHNYAYECGTLGMHKTTANSGGMYYVLGGYIHDNDIRQNPTTAASAFDSPGEWYGNSIFTQGNSYTDKVPLVTIGGDAVIHGEIYQKSSAGYINFRDDFSGKADIYVPFGSANGALVAKAVTADGAASTATAAIAGKIGITNPEFLNGNIQYDEDGNIVRLFSATVDPANADQYILGEYTAPVPQYTVTYTDGVEEEEVFADQTYTVDEGTATPVFDGTPEREGYTFEGWNPEVAATVTETVTYTAKWKDKAVARIESTGETFETLQAALDAVKALINDDPAHAAQTVTLLKDTKESVKLTWVKGLRIDYNFDLTIDLAGHTVTGDGSSVMDLSASGSGGAKYSFHVTINDTSAEKTGTITGGTAATGGGIKFTGATTYDALVINGGNFVGNTATSGGGAIYSSKVGVDVIINGGTFKENTASTGGAVNAPTIVMTGGVMTGNKAVGSASFTGRGGAICAWSTTTNVEITGGQIYGNTAEAFGDDIVFCSTSKAGASSPYLKMIAAADMNVDGVSGWYKDGVFDQYNTNRYAVDNAVEFTEYALYKGKGTANSVGLKAATEYVTVVYTDGVDDEVLFEDQTYTVAKGAATPAFVGTPERKGYTFAGWTPEVTENATANVTYTAVWAAPALPDKFGKNVTPALVRVICDSDEAHAPIDVKWQFRSTKVYPGAVMEWNAELDTWTIRVRIDSVSVYYVWVNFEKVYNDIIHTMVDESQKCIDTYLKWDAEKQLWVTMDENPIEVHVTCKTKPDAPLAENAGNYQIAVRDVAEYVNPYFFKIRDMAGTFTIGEVTGNRADGFFCDITVKFEEDDAYITSWMEKRGIEGYRYDWDKTPESITYTMKYQRDTTTTLYGESYGDWALAKNGSTYGTVGTVYARKDVTVTYNDGVEEEEVFADQSYTVALGAETPVFDGTPEREGYTFMGWAPEVAEKATEDVTYAATWEIKKYTITFDTNGGAAIDPVIVEHGTKYRLPSSPLAGFSQAGWYIVGTDTKLGNSVTVTSDLNLVMQRAILKPNFRVTIDSEYGYWNGETRTLTGDVKENAGLVYAYQWYKDGVLIEGATENTLTIAGNAKDSGEYKLVVTVTKADGSTVVTTNDSATGEASKNVLLRKLANTLFYDKNDGSDETPRSSYTSATSIVIREKPSREGYDFMGWNTKADGTGTMYQYGATYPFADPTDNNGNGGQKDTLYAQWKLKEYTITFDTNGGAPIDPVIVEHGTKYTLPSSPLAGFSQSGWYIVGTDTKLGKFVTVTSNLNLVMQRAILAPSVTVTIDDSLTQWNGKKRTLTATVNENEGLVYAYQWYKDGVLVEGATEKDLVLKGWVSDSGEYKVVVTATKADDCKVVTTNTEATAEKTIKVKINRLANTLRYNWNDGTEKISDHYTNANEIVVRQGAKRVGYTFMGWNTKADGTGTMYQLGANYPFADPTDNNGNGGQKDNLYAQWKANEYKVFFDTDGGSAVKPITVTYDEAVGELPSTTREGYRFLGWYDADGNKVSADTIYKVAGDSTYTAKWHRLTPDEEYPGWTFALHFDSKGGTPFDPMTVTYGEAIGTLPVPTLDGYTFIGWFDADGKEVTADMIYKVAGDTTVTAHWNKGVSNNNNNDMSATSPNTGDSAPIMLLATLMLAAAAVLVLGKKRYIVK